MDSILRDIDRERSKMQGDIDNLHRHYEKLQGFLNQYTQESTAEWARLALNHPQATLLIMETTRIVDKNGYAAYGDQNEPIRFTTLQLTTGEVFDQLLHPKHSQGITGTEYHGLMMADVEDKPTIDDIWYSIVAHLTDQHIIIFGQQWARLALQPARSERILDNAFCLHDKCKEYYNQFYELSLETVLQYQGIDKKREELKDSRERILMLAQVIRNLAAGMAKQDPFDPNFDSDKLDTHPF